MTTGADLTVGEEVTVLIGAVAHGGHCVARHDGRVLFVRHAIPGETVVARITEGGEGDRFLRADAVQVLEPSPDRVTPPCPYAGPGRCGGCDFQHVSLARQRELKAAVVDEQVTRLAGLDLEAAGLDMVVEPVPGDLDGLGWRTRVELAVDESGRAGLRRHRSHEVVLVDRCPIAVDAVNGSDAFARDWSDTDAVAVDIVAPSTGGTVTVPVGPHGDTGPEPVPTVIEQGEVRGVQARFEVSARGFWQVHPGAATTFTAAVLDALEPQPGERALDLYAGVGLFAFALAEAVGPAGQVLAVESDVEAVAHAQANLAGHPSAVVIGARVDDAFGVARRRPTGRSRRRSASPARTRHPLMPERAELVVLDPPRTGAGRAVLEAVTALRPRALAYVACDPAALARDTAYLADLGYRLTGLRAFDAFPMTHHVECVARFTPVQR